MDKKFYSKLKSAGYGAIQDINDMKYSKYNAKNPLIVFDNANKNIMVRSMKELTNEKEMVKKGSKEVAKLLAEETGKALVSPKAAVAVSGAAAYTYASDYMNYGDSNTTNKKNNK